MLCRWRGPGGSASRPTAGSRVGIAVPHQWRRSCRPRGQRAWRPRWRRRKARIGASNASLCGPPGPQDADRPEGRPLFLEMLRVDFDVALPLFRRFVEREDRLHGTRRNAGAAVDALVRMDEQLVRRFEPGLILPRMNAVHWA